MNRVRTRFAPSPTGYMHVGNLRTALYEYLIAKHNKGDFVLRIEDTDQGRLVEGTIDVIYDTLDSCGFQIDESPKKCGSYGPYVQSERIDIYKEYAHKLVEMGKAYYCFCDEERLDELRKVAEANKIAFLYDGCCKNLTKEQIEENIKQGKKYVIRQIMPKTGTTTYDDLVYGTISFENKLLEDQILLKSDGYPTYNFANVIDDHLMNITHIIRGNEYLSSTPKYNLLYEAFGWDIPTYIHVPPVMKDAQNKLSKRNGDASFQDLLKKGYLAPAIINYLALLGWSPETTCEVYSLPELIEFFNVNRINKSPAIFDIDKLKWVNSYYIKQLSSEALYELLYPFMSSSYDVSNKSKEWLEALFALFQAQLSFGQEIVELSRMFFMDTYNIDDEAQEFMKQDGVSTTVNVFADEIKNILDWNIENINLAINNTKEKVGVKGKMLYMPIMIKLIGKMHGPELPNIIYLFGIDKVINILKK
ncbi:MAG: glutamate--tRNA ligase [Bacilli bacterium]|jgi:glutamyl-tRNA synthetase